MKVLHIITTLQKSAGTTAFVNGASDALSGLGCDVSIAVYALGGEYVGEMPEKPLRIMRIADVPCSGEHFDIVHLHGLWGFSVNRMSRWAARNGSAVVWSPHGALSPWAMRSKRWKKFLPWILFQRRNLAAADILHATVPTEAKWIRDLGFSNEITIAPLGIKTGDIPAPSAAPCGEKRLLFVGRVYPVKGLVNLVKAWNLIGDGRQGWKLRIVGPDQAGHRAELERLAGELSLSGSVEFAGPKFGDSIREEYDSCECLVLPSFTENFGSVVVEAMARGKPCIASRFTPWEDLETGRCGLWVDNSPESLASAISKMIEAGDGERREMGLRGRALVERKYTWSGIAKSLLAAYEKALARRTSRV